MNESQQDRSGGEADTNRRDVLKAIGAGGASLSIAKQLGLKNTNVKTVTDSRKKVKLVEVQSVGSVKSTEGKAIEVREMNTDVFIEYSIQDETLIVPNNEVASGLEFDEFTVNSLDSYTNGFRSIDEPVRAVQNTKRIATELAPNMTPVRIASLKNSPAFGSVVLDEKERTVIEAKYRGTTMEVAPGTSEKITSKQNEVEVRIPSDAADVPEFSMADLSVDLIVKNHGELEYFNFED